MWFVFGILAIGATAINWYCYWKGKNYSLAMGVALSFTSFTLCAEQTLVSNWVKDEDWSSLMDVIPSMDKVLWILTILSVVFNLSPLLLSERKSD